VVCRDRENDVQSDTENIKTTCGQTGSGRGKEVLFCVRLGLNGANLPQRTEDSGQRTAVRNDC
jgi:hypothetical protein